MVYCLSVRHHLEAGAKGTPLFGPSRSHALSVLPLLLCSNSGRCIFHCLLLSFPSIGHKKCRKPCQPKNHNRTVSSGDINSMAQICCFLGEKKKRSQNVTFTTFCLNLLDPVFFFFFFTCLFKDNQPKSYPAWWKGLL